MKIEFKNALIWMWFAVLYSCMAVGLYLIFSDELKREFDHTWQFIFYFVSFIFVVATFCKLFNLDAGLTILSDKIILKKNRLFFIITNNINKDEVEMLSVKYNSMTGGYLTLVLKNKRKITIHLDIGIFLDS